MYAGDIRENIQPRKEIWLQKYSVTSRGRGPLKINKFWLDPAKRRLTREGAVKECLKPGIIYRWSDIKIVS